ncbi:MULTISPECIES: hypothetical protein [unclassified Kitasatospora]|uniref:hypothetical protein n=1 Tax=unclassified Kitasatospora TaxID=2633591 RepID=UPI0038110701
MTGSFDGELREQLVRARHSEAEARADGDEDGALAYAGRAAELLRLAGQHGIELPPDAPADRP